MAAPFPTDISRQYHQLMLVLVLVLVPSPIAPPRAPLSPGKRSVRATLSPTGSRARTHRGSHGPEPGNPPPPQAFPRAPPRAPFQQQAQHRHGRLFFRGLGLQDGERQRRCASRRSARPTSDGCHCNPVRASSRRRQASILRCKVAGRWGLRTRTEKITQMGRGFARAAEREEADACACSGSASLRLPAGFGIAQYLPCSVTRPDNC